MVPTLEEVFALASKGSFKFNIETKIFPEHPEFAPPPDAFVCLVLALISPNYHLVTPEQVRVAHTAGIPVVPWNADTAANWNRLMDAGVDAIITDDPVGLIAHLKPSALGDPFPAHARDADSTNA